MSTNGNKPTFLATKISIHQIAGIDHLEFSPGAVTVVRGRNAAGKTSLLKALQSVPGAEDAKLLRKGEKKGEVVIVFRAEDGRTLTAQKTFRESGSPITKLTDQDGKDAGGATIMKALWNAINANPMRFIQAEKKERLRVLLETISIEFDQGQLENILWPKDSDALGGIVSGSTPFDTIELTKDAVFDRRTNVNRDVKKDKATIESLVKDLPPEAADCESELKEARAKKERFEKTRRDVLAEAKANQDQAIEVAQGDCHRAIAEAQAERDKAVQAARTEYEQQTAANEEEAGPAIADAAAAVTTWEERQKNSIAANERRQIIAKTRTELAANEALSGELTTALDAIEKLKGELLETLPIKGLEVRDGDILFNGVPFEECSTAEQLSVAIKVAKLRAGEIGLVAVDRIEALDPLNFAAFVEMAKESGLQWICAGVAAGELEITEP